MTAAPRTLLAIVQQAQMELGLPEASSVIGNVDGTTLQMMACAQKIGEEIRDTPEDGWSTMHVEFDLAVPPPISTTGNITANSPVITNIPSTAGLAANAFSISGPILAGGNLPVAARILSVDSLTQVTMTMEATASGTGVGLLFGQDTFSLPSDFRNYSDRTFWDRTNRWELLGPDSPQMDQWHRSGIVVTGPRRHFRNIGRIQGVNPTFRLWPPPFEIVAPIQLAFEYISTDWICVQGGAGVPPTPQTFASTWQYDTDIPVLDDRAMIDGIKWMFWKAKGFNWAEARQDWLDLVDRLIARDGGAPTLQLAKRVHPIFISPAAIQDGFFPGPVGPNTG
jgi:hypothetical protein